MINATLSILQSQVNPPRMPTTHLPTLPPFHCSSATSPAFARILTKSNDPECARPWKPGTEPTPVHHPIHNEWIMDYRIRPSTSSLPCQCTPGVSGKRNGNPPTRRLLHHLQGLVDCCWGDGEHRLRTFPALYPIRLKTHLLRVFRPSVHHPVLVRQTFDFTSLGQLPHLLYQLHPRSRLEYSVSLLLSVSEPLVLLCRLAPLPPPLILKKNVHPPVLSSAFYNELNLLLSRCPSSTIFNSSSLCPPSSVDSIWHGPVILQFRTGQVGRRGA